MSDVIFNVNITKYHEALLKATRAGIYAVAEQIASDSNRYVKFDTGTLHDSMRVEHVGDDAQVVWSTPYALRQYYTGQPIDHAKGDGPPHLQWAHYAESIHGKDWQKIMQKAFIKGLV